MNNILIIGSGSREHCIADILSNYEKNNVYVLKGNDGMKYFNPIQCTHNNTIDLDTANLIKFKLTTKFGNLFS